MLRCLAVVSAPHTCLEHGHPSQRRKGCKSYKMATCKDTPTSTASKSVHIYQHFVSLLSMALAHVAYHSEQQKLRLTRQHH